MGSTHETNPSLWIGSTDADPASVDERHRLPGRFDVVVVGAGITGLTVARLLVAESASVAVVEAGSLAAGATGYTTAKITALQRTRLSEIAGRNGDGRAEAYVSANRAAVEAIAERVAADGIDCDFERAAACTYTERAEDVPAIEREHETALRLGLSTRFDRQTELPFPVAAAVWLDGQAQFDPRRYCLGLAGAIAREGGAVFDHTPVVDVAEEPGHCVVTTEHGQVRAGQVVLATHLPFLGDGAFFARAHPHRSYAIAVRLDAARVRSMYISAETPTRSVRSTGDGFTIVGGEGHKVGHEEDTRRCYRALERWARDRFGAETVDYRWSAQDHETLDGLPYVGRLTAGHDRVWIATGFGKWGMTNGTAAATVLADLLAGRDNVWLEAFDSTRLAPAASARRFVSENLDVGKRFVGDRLHRARPAAELGRDEGAIVELDGRVVAAYRDSSGELHAVSATCTHLGCRVTFNTAERSWDCPCHGSRFSVDGDILEGPAVRELPVLQPQHR